MKRFMAAGVAASMALGFLSGLGSTAQAEGIVLASAPDRAPASMTGSAPFLPPPDAVPLKPWYKLPIDQQPSAARPPERRVKLLSSDPAQARSAMAPGTPAWWGNYYPGTVVPIR
jgi:hypothetical protein